MIQRTDTEASPLRSHSDGVASLPVATSFFGTAKMLDTHSDELTSIQSLRSISTTKTPSACLSTGAMQNGGRIDGRAPSLITTACYTER